MLGCGTPLGWVVAAWAQGVLVGAAAACRPCCPRGAAVTPTETQLVLAQSSCCVARDVAGGEVLHVPVRSTYVCGVAAAVLRQVLLGLLLLA